MQLREQVMHYARPRFKDHFPADGVFISGLDTGIEKCVSSSGMFCSIFSTENWDREELPF